MNNDNLMANFFQLETKFNLHKTHYDAANLLYHDLSILESTLKLYISESIFFTSRNFSDDDEESY